MPRTHREYADRTPRAGDPDREHEPFADRQFGVSIARSLARLPPTEATALQTGIIAIGRDRMLEQHDGNELEGLLRLFEEGGHTPSSRMTLPANVASVSDSAVAVAA